MLDPSELFCFVARRFTAACILGVATVAGFPTSADAHGDLDEQIKPVSRQLDHAPSAALFVLRAELHQEHEDFTAALADFDEAARLNPQLEAVEFGRARTLFKAGQFEAARVSLNHYLAKKSAHADGFLLRARVLVALKDYAAAVRDFDRNIALMPQPLPECILERAAALDASGDKSGAVKSLDEAIRRLGNLVTLQSAAIAFELGLHRYESALARCDRIIADMRRKETWLARRGEILAAAGRHDEALHAYKEALAALEQLALQHRQVKPMRDLEARLHQLLGT